MQELTHNNWTNREQIINPFKNKKKCMRQNDNTRQLQVGCAASRHHSVSEVNTEQKFQGCLCP